MTYRVRALRNCAVLLLAVSAAFEAGASELAQVAALRVSQAGALPAGVAATNGWVLANEPGADQPYLVIDFELEALAQVGTPLARLQLVDLVKIQVKRPGQKSGTGRGALHVFACPPGAAEAEMAGAAAVKPAGLATPYTIDVTRAVSAALARPAGQRKLRLELRMIGQPAYYEVYALSAALEKAPVLEVAPQAGWADDWAQRVEPLRRGPLVYREACLPMVAEANREALPPLLYSAQRIVEVVNNATGERLQEGRDWSVREGRLVLPPGTRAPVQVEKAFFVRHPKPGELAQAGAAPQPQSVVLMEGTWYHERQIEVTYEPASRGWEVPRQACSLKGLPRLRRLLEAKAPVRLLVFGDSISLGGNASKVQGGWPYQPCFGELVVWELERRTGCKITYMNHSRGGAGAAYGASQAESQVGWFKPDLVLLGYGMNDRRPERQQTFLGDMEKIVDTVRACSPETEFVVVTPMLNNPKQPDKGEAILQIRDTTLKIKRPGLVFADVTAVERELLKHKNYLDFSGNGANHPNDFIHRIYAQTILEVLLGNQESAGLPMARP